MKQRFLNSTISFLKSQQSFDLKDEKKLLYGLEGIYLTIHKEFPDSRVHHLRNGDLYIQIYDS